MQPEWSSPRRLYFLYSGWKVGFVQNSLYRFHDLSRNRSIDVRYCILSSSLAEKNFVRVMCDSCATRSMIIVPWVYFSMLSVSPTEKLEDDQFDVINNARSSFSRMTQGTNL